MDRKGSGMVVLLHGIWTNGWELILLKKRLERAGFDGSLFRYPALKWSLEKNGQALERFILKRQKDQGGKVSLVGHSYGGIVACSLINRLVDEGRLGRLKIKKCIFLGSPLLGSSIARRLGRFHWFRLMTGKSLGPLKVGCRLKRPEVVRSMMIAGTLNVGFGMFFIRGAGDGVVAVSETNVPWIDVFHTLHTTHLGLVFSKRVADWCIDFLS